MKKTILLLFVLAVALSASAAFAYTVPNQSDLLFGVNTDSFPASGATGAWARTDSAGGTFTTLATPTVDAIGATPVLWEKNVYATGTGYSGGTQASAIPINGATIVTVIKPLRSSDSGNWRSIVDVLYDQFCLLIANNTGQLGVKRGTGNGTGTSGNVWGPAATIVPDQQSTVVSVVMASDGTWKMYLNGTLAWTYTTTTTLTQLSRASLNTWGIGRNTFDGWSTYNGDLGDVYVWKVALDDASRQQLENDLMAKFHAGASYPSHTITASTTGGGGTITPSGSATVQYEADQTFAISKAYGYVADVVVDGASQGDVPSYTFNDVVADHTITVNYSALPTHILTGHVDAAPGGGATVSVKTSPTATPSQQTTTDASGNFSMTVPEGDYYLCASQTGYMISPDTAISIFADTAGINFSLTAKRNIPKMEYLLFAADSSDMGDAGTAGNWNILYNTIPVTPAVTAATAITTPTVTKLRGIKYDLNNRGTGGDDGYRVSPQVGGVSALNSPIPTTGATVVALVSPIRNSTSDGWNSVVDIFRDNLILGVKNNTGQVQVRRNGTDYWSANDAAHTIPSGQITILSLVVQSDGTFTVYASAWNGATHTFGSPTTILSSTATSAFNAFIPAQVNLADWAKYINIGRNNGDGWSTFNGYIGDVFVYKTALSATDRATLEADINTKLNSIPAYTITATAGPNGSISPAGDTSVGETDSQSYTITPNFGYDVADVLVDGASVGAVTTYTFTNVTAAHTIAASFAAKPARVVSGQVTDSATGNPIAGAKVYVSTTANASVSPINTLTTDASGNYSVTLFDATWYVTASATGYTTPADQTVAVSGADVSGVNFALAASGKHIPEMDKLIFSLYGTALTVNGATTNAWPLEHPAGATAAVMGTPTVTTVDGTQWEQNRYATADGYRVTQFMAPVPVNGITATAVVQPQGDGVSGGNWTSIIDVLYSRFILGIRGTDGVLVVRRNGDTQYGPAIPNGQKTVLTAVVQPTGQYQVFANGIKVMDITSTSDMTSLVPGVNTGGAGNFDSYINIGRNNPDGWTTYSGNIGAAFLWKMALSQGERIAFETELGSTFGITMPTYYNITASSNAGGTISPSGVVPVLSGSDQTFTIAANVGYAVSDVLVDGVSQGAISTYTFPAVSGDHTIAVTFAAVPQHAISGKVIDSATGTGIAGATVYFSTTPNAFVAPYDTATTDASGNFSKTTYDGAIYVSASASGYYNSADKAVTMSGANVTGINFVLASNTRHTPATDQLLFSALTDVLPNSGATGNWATDFPVGGSLAPMNGPTASIIDGIKWENNSYTAGTGYVLGQYSSPIACNGATIVAVIKPTRNTTSNGWDSVVDLFYDQLVLGIHNDTGLVAVRRDGNVTTAAGQDIPDGQKTVLSLVVQPDGSYKVYANGTEIAMTNNGAITGGLVLNPTRTGSTGYWSNINVGRNNPDGWTTFNGNIGDVFVYTTALTDAQRTQLEWDLFNKFGIGGQSVTISGQVIDANGNVPVAGAQVVVQVSGVDVPTIAAVTDANGNYTAQARLNAGDSFTVHASKLNYMPGDSTPPVTYDGTTTIFTGVDVLVQSIATVNISGTVTDFITGNPVGGLKLSVYVSDTQTNYPVTTQSDGTYSVDVGAGSTSYVINLDPTNSPMPVMLTDLASRTVAAPGGLYDNVTGKDLLVSYPSTLTGKVVTSDSSSAAGFAVVAKDDTGATTSATTAADGTYTISVLPGFNYTVVAKKSGYVTMPGPQTVNVSAGNTSYSVGDFNAIPTTISGVLKDAATGQPIYNGVVQSGTGPMSSAVVTDNTGAFTLPAIGCGGVELFGDALGYHCDNYFVTGSGVVKKDLALTAQAETGVVLNGGFENVANGQPTDWTEKWATGGMTFASSTDVPDAFSGTYSAFFTATAQYDALAQYVQVQPNSLYTCYFKAKADPEVATWFPMVSFRGDYTDTDGTVYPDSELKGWVSGETGHAGWSHTPPYIWMQYLKFQTYSGDAIQPFVRIAPPVLAAPNTVANIAASFCYADVPPAGKGCYIDDVVIDRVDANEPLVTVAPDPNEPPATDVADLAALKAKAGTGETVNLTGTVTVASKGNGLFFVGEGLYQSTIMVKANGHSVPAAGTSVTSLKGTVTKDSFNQYTLTLSADPAAATSGAVLKAVAMNNRSAKNDPGALNKLVRVWGNVSGSTIDDGYGNPITVKDASLGTGTVAVSGVLWKDTDGSVVLYQDLP